MVAGSVDAAGIGAIGNSDIGRDGEIVGEDTAEEGDG